VGLQSEDDSRERQSASQPPHRERWKAEDGREGREAEDCGEHLRKQTMEGATDIAVVDSNSRRSTTGRAEVSHGSE